MDSFQLQIYNEEVARSKYKDVVRVYHDTYYDAQGTWVVDYIRWESGCTPMTCAADHLRCFTRTSEDALRIAKIIAGAKHIDIDYVPLINEKSL